MKNFLIVIEYNGSKYYGWNLQPGKDTIVSELTKALAKFYKGKIEIKGSGRTDRGVHATAQKASLVIDVDILAEKIMYLWNKNLPVFIKIKSIKNVPEDFHARYSAIDKTYEYRVNTSDELSTFNNEFSWLIKEDLNISIMKEASKFLIGKKDFTSFATINKKDRENNMDTIKTIISISIFRKEEKIIFRVKGKGFMRHMVRKIVGSLIEVGKGNLTKDDLLKALNKKDSSAIQNKAPASGLYLVEVNY